MITLNCIHVTLYFYKNTFNVSTVRIKIARSTIGYSEVEEVALRLPLADGEPLGLLLGPLDGDWVLLGASDGITLGLWLGWLEKVIVGLPVADGESLGLLLYP